MFREKAIPLYEVTMYIFWVLYFQVGQQQFRCNFTAVPLHFAHSLRENRNLSHRGRTVLLIIPRPASRVIVSKLLSFSDHPTLSRYLKFISVNLLNSEFLLWYFPLITLFKIAGSSRTPTVDILNQISCLTVHETIIMSEVVGFVRSILLYCKTERI